MVTSSLPTAISKTTLQPFSYSIVHACAGRIRLRIPQLNQFPHDALSLERSLSTCPGVLTISVNPAACSVTICYAPSQISLSQFQQYLTTALQQVTTPLPPACTTKVLAQRLGVPFQALNWRRSQVNFAEWSRSKDPQGLAWNYDPGSKCFFACKAVASHTDATSAKVERIYHALTEAAGGHLGSTVGRVTGEVIGMVLLGASGAIVGAEIGTVVGEIIGGELSNA